MSEDADRIIVRNTRPEDFAAIERISREIYPNDYPWTADYLASHRTVFPEGQFVAVDRETERVAGMAASLIITWNDYAHLDRYLDVTDGGYFTNHDPRGRTLYGAEVMVDPAMRRRGIGSKLYAARRALVERMGLLRIRAAARLPGYYRYADTLTPDEYVVRVVNKEIDDPTLSFQLRHDFHVLAVVMDYFARDPKSKGCAALIEWINTEAARPQDYADRNPRFQPASVEDEKE